ncbi:MAG: hypothetical protein PHP82_04090 [Candidatus ainarchaeum sp.]|nr:hypothetical protein [Candidatus ainarchaeum sp.]
MQKNVVGAIILIIFLVLIIITIFFIKNNVPLEGELKDCLEAGEIYQSPAFLGEKRGECCDGLTIIAQYGIVQGEYNCEMFEQLGGGNTICSNCGNDICEEWENKCNCPKDCNYPVTTQNEEYFCVGNVPAKYHFKFTDEGDYGEAWVKIEEKQVKTFSRIERKGTIDYDYITVDKSNSDKSKWTRTYNSFFEDILYDNMNDWCNNRIVHEWTEENDFEEDFIPVLYSGFPIIAWENFPLDIIESQSKKLNNISCNEVTNSQMCISKEYCVTIYEKSVFGNLYQILEFIDDDFSDNVFDYPFCGQSNCYDEYGNNGFRINEISETDDWVISEYSCFVEGLSKNWTFNYN